MGQSSRSSSTLKKTFQTFKSFAPIQQTTSTTRMKYAFAILVIACAVAAANATHKSNGWCLDPNRRNQKKGQILLAKGIPEDVCEAKCLEIVDRATGCEYNRKNRYCYYHTELLGPKASGNDKYACWTFGAIGCGDDQFTCNKGRVPCTWLTNRCNGEKDCDDGSDEQGCKGFHTCMKKSKKFVGKCRSSVLKNQCSPEAVKEKCENEHIERCAP